LGTDNNNVYAKLGALLSVVLLAAIASSYAFGRLIDRRRGGDLMQFSVIGDALVHAVRPFVTSVGVVLGINIANEMTTTGYTLAFVRGMFDTADLSGHRITYLACIEVMANLGAAIAGVAFVICVLLFGDVQGMKNFFFVAAVAVLIIGSAKFHLYRK
jgi:sugar phosphate permease